MLPEQQQRILGYFIEEARDHLNTIEQGLLNLESTLNDPEMVNEVFRAAHSIKGGAAMLGLTSIQHVSHRLEDCFKVLKENPIRVDQKLESLFLGVSDTLKALLEQLSGPFGLSEETANTLMSETEPVFQWLNQHLELLVQQGGATGDTSATHIQPALVETVGTLTEIFFRQDVPTAAENTPPTTTSQPVTATANDHWGEFQTQVLQTLREMLQLFKQQATPASRQNLQQCCNQLVQLGKTWNLPNWCNLCKAASVAIGNSENSYLTLAKIVITEIKQSQELVLHGREAEITISQQLEALWGFPETALLEVAQDLLGDVPDAVKQSLTAPVTNNSIEKIEAASSAITEDFHVNTTVDLPADSVTSLTEVSEQIDPQSDIQENRESSQSENDIAAHIFLAEEVHTSVHRAKVDAHGPEVGLAELNTLADLFEGETPELDDSWQQEEILEAPNSSELGVDIHETVIQEFDSDLADFLSVDGDTDEPQSNTDKTEDLSLLFDDNFLEKEILQKSTSISDEILQEGSQYTDNENYDDDLEEFLHLKVDASNSHTNSINQIDTDHTSHIEASAQISNRFDDLFVETDLNTDDLEEINLSKVSESKQVNSSEYLTLDNLFTEVAETTAVSIDESEINDLFDEKPTTVLEFFAAEDDLGNFWNQDDLVEPKNNLSSVVENDLAKELEESLFTGAASDDIFDESQHSANSGLESLELLNLDATFLQPEQQLDLMPPSKETEDDLFAELSVSESSINDSISDREISPPEIHGFSQSPEALDFIPEFTNQLPETASEDSHLSFAELPFDLFNGGDDNSNEQLLENIDNLVNDLFATVNDFNLQPEQTTEVLNNDSTLETNNELTDIEEISELSSVDNLLAVDTQLPISMGEWVIPISEVENIEVEDSSLEIDNELLEPVVEETTELDLIESFLEMESDVSAVSDELLDTAVEETVELDLDESFLEISGVNSEIINIGVENSSLEIGDELLDTAVEETVELDLDESFLEISGVNSELTNIGVEDSSLEIGDELLDTAVEETVELDLDESFLEISGVNSELTNIGVEDSSLEIGDEPEPTSETPDLDEFADLEALLEEEPSLSSNVNSIPEDDFASLEALLGEDNAQTTTNEQPAAIQPVVRQYIPATTNSNIALPVVEDEFSDLEKLLAEADQSISQSTPVKPSVGRSPRTSTRRQARFEETMKVPVKQLDDMSNLVGELVVNRNTLEQDHERLRQSLDNLLIQVQQLSDVGARMQELYERSLLEASLLASRKTKEIPVPMSDSNLDRGFSELEMDRFTPFHTLSQEMIELIVRVRESASDIDFVTEETERVARQFRQVTTQLQEGLTRARMVPFSQTIDRLRRGVRDNAIKYGKQVELVIEGGDTLIDKMILDHLTDPLTHMLNNAIAHGIETPDIREAAGKLPVGIITIRAFHQGNQTVISVGDDGAGIDTERIKTKAVNLGMVTPEQAKTISRLEIYDLLFHAGFSTKDEADEISGRGVGMDVVRSEISEIRGTVNTDSTLGKGTTFTIRLPLTLSICKALCCVSDKARIAFPMDGVEDTLDISSKNVQNSADGQSFISWRDTVLPFRPLKELLTFNRQLSRGSVYGGNRDDDMISVVVVRSGNTLLGLQIDQVLSEQEIVIKQFEGPAPKPIGVAGATVLGDGRIMPIADVLELIDIFQGRMSKHSGSTPWQQSAPPSVPETPAEKIDPTVLIVDDSITVRELLSLTFNKAGYRVEQARDGQEAWDKLRSGLPCDIVFCDIEMPRCDGLELLSRIQKDSNLNHLPIAMLTSRGADKHRQMAIQLGASGYFTKPYLEEALLEAAVRMLKGEKLVNSGSNG
jgi:chemosensory pili system protein ChpA (sensor histidine kinase/response regulator)